MISFRALFERGYLRGAPARLLLAGAYRRTLVEGNATQQDRDLVLTELANQTGYYRVSPADTGDVELRFAEGKRLIMARILHHLRMPRELQQELEDAARQEQLTKTEGGELRQIQILPAMTGRVVLKTVLAVTTDLRLR